MELQLLMGFMLAMAAEVYCQTDCLPNIPPFMDRGGGNTSRLPNGIQAIVPTYTFSCYGRILEWGACVEPGNRRERYDIHFQVWRSQPAAQTSSFSLIGSNVRRNLRPSRSCVTVTVPVDEQIAVEPGDVVGLYFSHTNPRRRMEPAGVQVDNNAAGIDVWYEDGSPLCSFDSNPQSFCALSIGAAGDLRLRTTGAPIITAEIEIVVPTTVPLPIEGVSSSHFEILVSSTISKSATTTSSTTASDLIQIPTTMPPPSNTAQPSNSLHLQPSSVIIQTSLQKYSPTPVSAIVPGEPNTNPIPSQSTSPPNDAENTDPLPSSQKSLTAIIVGVVAGVLFAAFAISVIIIAVVILVRKQRKGRSRLKDIQNTLENPLYTGVHSVSEYPPVFTGCYDAVSNGSPQYELLPQCEAQPYEMPRKIDIYATLSSEATLASSSSTYFGTEPRDTIKRHYEWDIYVPTLEQRRALAQINTTDQVNDPEEIRLGCEAQDPVYAILEEGSSLESVEFFQESATYWSPSSDQSQLYSQLSSKKYREIPRYQIQTTEQLGSGHFGTVSKSIWQSRVGSMEVAVKTLQAEASETDEVRFLQEAAINGQFKHPNIVKLLGVVTVGKPVMIVLELLPNGDLRNYLVNQLSRAEGSLPTNTPKQLLGFCKQIASGMEYLSKKAFVHRDLAARNILVAKDKTCKISDFGMSRDLENESYYISQGGKIPIKWTAPEAIYFKKYSTASDVWSYGAVMYEIWSMGHRPFHGYTNQQAMTLVSSGFRLHPPPGTPKEIYRLMINCWHPDSSARPTFTEIVTALSEPSADLLPWSEAMAAVLGGPLEASIDLYPELQRAYTHDLSLLGHNNI